MAEKITQPIEFKWVYPGAKQAAPTEQPKSGNDTGLDRVEDLAAQDWVQAQTHGGNRRSDQGATLHLETVKGCAAESGASDKTQRIEPSPTGFFVSWRRWWRSHA